MFRPTTARAGTARGRVAQGAALAVLSAGLVLAVTPAADAGLPAGDWHVAAHRGGIVWGPEHTPATFAHLLEVGADAVELDVRFTRDGVPVVVHDDTLDRTTDCEGEVRETLLRELRACDAGSWFAPRFAGQRTPTLAAALSQIAAGSDEIEFYLHVKTWGPAEAAAIMDAVEARGLPERVTTVCDTAECLAAMRAAGSERAGRVFNTPAGWASTAQVLVPYNIPVTPAALRAAQRAGQMVLPVENHPHSLIELRAMGVDGVIADDLDAAIRQAGR